MSHRPYRGLLAANRVTSARTPRLPRWSRRPPWRAVAVAVGVATGLAAVADDAVAQPAPTARIVVRLDVGQRPASRTFAGSQDFTLFAEQGGFLADYEIQPGRIVDGGISLLLWRNLGVGIGVSSYRSVNPAQITADVPHPFFFDLPRATTGVADGLERQELGVHVRALWMSQFQDWLVVSLSAGPSLINARQDLVSAIEYSEIGFPFDRILYAGHAVIGQSETTVGANFGIDVDAFALHKLPFLERFEVMDRVGLGLLLRYVRGAVNLQVGDHPVEVDLGGLQLTAGLRVRF